MSLPFAYKGQAVLLRWSDSHKGRTVTLLLEDTGERHPFGELKCGHEHGQRMQIACVLVNDAEEPVANATASSQGGEAEKETPAGEVPNTNARIPELSQKRERTRSQIAALKLTDPYFQNWLIPRYADQTEINDRPAAAIADAVLKRVLGIGSKSELDSNPAKAEAWDRLETSFRFRDQVRS